MAPAEVEDLSADTRLLEELMGEILAAFRRRISDARESMS